MEQGVLLILSGPSGSGKGTVMKRYIAGNPNAFLSVSMTTRAPRAGEREGVDYFFVTKRQFEESISENKFLEYAGFGENYYGTPVEPVMAHLRQGHLVFLEIEVKGALEVKRKMPEAVLVFFTPSDFAEVEKRLRKREEGRMPEEEILNRLRIARSEYARIDDYDYIVLNNRVETAADELSSIAQAELCKRRRRAAIIKQILSQ